MSQKKAEKKYTAEKLLGSKALAGYQKDFAKVILGNGTYTIQEAKAALDKVLTPGKSGEKKGDGANA
ncbi:hypothetical protein B5E84_18045 [Lachnoclostridium sp. An14]|uniref:hypothetical protein n=1 Tax=Lachnoclostridium sp. An14 TaxID=1965562 RepID=UPI000B377EA0|nr:hypothetical protein [Lachnoclostridium sp. An14]OUQ13026.1 hypothetical protein B5E84_18045 [Lachnoclostridium sp. An14]